MGIKIATKISDVNKFMVMKLSENSVSDVVKRRGEWTVLQILSAMAGYHSD